MAGMFFTGDATFASFGLATILVVAVAVLGSLTVLPALLSRLGDRVDAGRVPFSRRRREGREGRFWGAIVDRVLRHPVMSLVLAGGLLIALAIPALQLRTAEAGVESLPDSISVIDTYDRVQAAFPGTETPAVVVVEAADVRSVEVQRAIGELQAQALATGQMHEPIDVDVNEQGTIATVAIPIDGNGTDEALQGRARRPARRGRPRHRRGAPGRRDRRDRADGPVGGLRRADALGAAAGVRLRAAVRLPADALRLPLDRHRAQGDRAQPALGGRRLRDPGPGVPARLGPEPARGRLHRRHRPGHPDPAVRDPVRAVDGLPRVHPQPDPRAARPRATPTTRRSAAASPPRRAS